MNLKTIDRRNGNHMYGETWTSLLIRIARKKFRKAHRHGENQCDIYGLMIF